MNYKLLVLLLICFILVPVDGFNNTTNSTTNVTINSTINITNISNITITPTPTIGPTPTQTICPAQVIPDPVKVIVTQEVEKIVYQDKLVQHCDENTVYNERREADIQFVKDGAKIFGIGFIGIYILSVLIRGIRRKND